MLFYWLFSVILKVVATLLKNSTPSTDLMEVRRLFLSDMIKLFSNSRENRRWGSLPFSPHPPWQQLTAWWMDKKREQKKQWHYPLLLCLMGTPVTLHNPWILTVFLSQQMFQWHIWVSLLSYGCWFSFSSLQSRMLRAPLCRHKSGSQSVAQCVLKSQLAIIITFHHLRH